MLMTLANTFMTATRMDPVGPVAVAHLPTTHRAPLRARLAAALRRLAG